MRRLALLGLCTLSLSGCAFQEWWRPPFITGPDPYAPAGSSENLRRSLGQPVASEPLQPQPGNIWPGPIQPTPSLADLARQEREGQLPQIQLLPNQPPAPAMPQNPGVGLPPPVPTVPPVAPPAQRLQPQSGPGVLETPQGPAVTSNGSGTFKTITMPNGTTGIVVPNGNGTSTIILNNGQVQTVPDQSGKPQGK